MFSHVRRVDGKLVVLNLVQLAFVSLMPFTSVLTGEYGGYLISQVVYSINMAALSIVALATGRYVHRHPELCSQPLSLGRYSAARLRLVGLIVISVVAIGIAFVLPWPSVGSMAFVLMAVIGPVSRRLEHRIDSSSAPASM